MKKSYSIALALIFFATTSSLFSMEQGTEKIDFLKKAARNMDNVKIYKISNYIKQDAPKSLSFLERRFNAIEEGFDTMVSSMIMQVGVQVGVGGLVWIINKIMKNKSSKDLEKEITQQKIEANKLQLRQKDLELKERQAVLAERFLKLREKGVDNIDKFIAQYSNKSELKTTAKAAAAA